MTDLSDAIIHECTERGLTIAVAESLTGGSLVATLIETPGASLVVRGGVVAYDTAVKHSVLRVDGELLEREGAVHPEVARQMAQGVRELMSVAGRPADIGVATTGVAGPAPQDGRPVGLVYVGLATESGSRSVELHLTGERSDIRNSTVSESLVQLRAALEAL
jgi:nicotinamide-nucleotide amidase